ncbi:hypothetical protein Dimus_025782 [Dionaea muscipula]
MLLGVGAIASSNFNSRWYSSSSSSSCDHPTPLQQQQYSQKSRKFTITIARKQDFEEESRTQQKQKQDFPLNVPFKLLAQSAITVLGLGFVDAGYSGDWSRIGVISREDEDMLKTAAFLVIPLCFGFIFYLSTDPEEPH